MPRLSPEAIALLFTDARSANGFSPEPVSDDLLREIWDIAKMGPTSANSLPLRVAFVRTPEAKERLLAGVFPGNVEKTRSAPVTAIFAYDVEFFEQMHRTFPQRDMSGMFRDNAALAQLAGVQGGTLQAAYFMLAARGLGLDCGPMGGFDSAKVDEAFFAGTTWRSLFLCNLGYMDRSKLFPRNPRLGFEDACKLL